MVLDSANINMKHGVSLKCVFIGGTLGTVRAILDIRQSHFAV